MSEAVSDSENAATETDLSKMSPAQVAALMSDAEGWKPEIGDEVEGVVVGMKIGNSDFKAKAGRDPRYPILFVLTAELDCIAVHCFQAILENEVRTQRPMPGEEIFIKFIGPAENAKKGQNPAMRYAIYVKRDMGSSDPYAALS